MNAAVVPKVHHQFPAENPTEIAVASTHGQPAQIVSLAIPEGNYVPDVGAVSGVGEVSLFVCSSSEAAAASVSKYGIRFQTFRSYRDSFNFSSVGKL